jgi:hypothetical protein
VVAEYRKRTKHKLLQEERKIKAKQGHNGREHIASKAATAVSGATTFFMGGMARQA